MFDAWKKETVGRPSDDAERKFRWEEASSRRITSFAWQWWFMKATLSWINYFFLSFDCLSQILFLKISYRCVCFFKKDYDIFKIVLSIFLWRENKGSAEDHHSQASHHFFRKSRFDVNHFFKLPKLLLDAQSLETIKVAESLITFLRSDEFPFVHNNKMALKI